MPAMGDHTRTIKKGRPISRDPPSLTERDQDYDLSSFLLKYAAPAGQESTSSMAQGSGTGAGQIRPARNGGPFQDSV